MKLRLRFIIFSLVLIVVSFLAVWASVKSLAENIIEQWAVRYAEKQILFDRERTLQPIMREIVLSRQFASSIVIRAFAENPDDPALRATAIQEMENFRFTFAEANYFVAIKQSGEYFHNDSNNTYAGRQLRYLLDSSRPQDSWFFKLIEQRRNIHINVNPDVALGVTKLWIDVLMMDGNKVLGVVGTGLNLTRFLNEIVASTDEGVTNLFIDSDAAIQLYHDRSMINFASISKDHVQKITAHQLLDSPDDKEKLTQALKQARSKRDLVVSDFVMVKNTRNLMAIAYIPELDWYEVTLIDITKLLPISKFSGIFIVYALSIVSLIILFNLFLRRTVLKPLRHLEQAMAQVKQGQPLNHQLEGQGEIGALMMHFSQMAASVHESKLELEAKVQQRTEALERLSQTDTLTQLLNRRGMSEYLESALIDNQAGFGFIWLDVDYFKEINDLYGHAQGDYALKEIANVLNEQVASSGFCARWGGDEFLACLPQSNDKQLFSVAERIRLLVTQLSLSSASNNRVLPLSVSIGVHLSREEESLEQALHCADSALYQAKAEGRNRVCCYSEG
ncbi:diguanylate cyclase (GGDEF) domain-containing protein [Oceanospirillum multiglobuliferum]|uniref:diguanylate cyclase n=1 Tax=Oceanospirillum multiglobuliferum TaxID=64969 RepID=A0A1T4QCZ1_9GAMM|nr:diguanylate cyclase [Oceanospirillum multiglobuliferum]OPX56513.1 hypothetical protein BTE48_03555 [Oceanospirillum multiglobuliferum]SKA01477.1 diguanylate cyclase (GGDEF) domain-containing protein [Oceanospirillum multiglobuliferum]